MYGNTSDGSMELLKTLVGLFIIGVIVLIAFSMLHEIIKGEFAFKDIPMTTHAVESHAEQNWNATTIQEYFDEGNCSPDSCVSGDTRIYYCEYGPQPKYSLVLIVGKTVERIITGYMTDTNRIGRLCTK